MAECTATAAVRGLVRALILLSMVAPHAAAQEETCTSVTVTGGDFAGVYEQGTDSSSFLGVDEASAFVLQAVAFGDSRTRRDLQNEGEGNGRRGLADDCASQMWIMADTSAVEDGFPYYSTFDCAGHPASVESTWLLVECVDCAEVAPITVVCTSTLGSGDTTLTSSEGDDGVLSLPAIIGIVAGGLVLLLCLGFCFCRRKKRGRKGSHTFADDSEHTVNQTSQKVSGVGGVGIGTGVGGSDVAIMRGDSSGMGGGASSGGGNGKGPVPSYTTAVGDTIESPLGGGGGGGGVGSGGSAGSGDRGLIGNGKSFKHNHAGGSTPAYDGIFSSRPVGSGGGGRGGRIAAIAQGTGTTMPHRPAVEMSKYAGPRPDSMAAAAAAVAASAPSRAQGSGAGGAGVGSDSPEAFASVLKSGVVEGAAGAQALPPARGGAAAGGGIKWSAGQNLGPQGGYDDEDISSYGDDSAAGSVYELQPTNDTLEHRYNTCDDSVAASSPGAYSLYSHYTAGGGGVPSARGGAGSGDWSSSNGDSPRPEADGVAGGAGGVGGASRRTANSVPSPAGMVARVDRHGRKNGAASPAAEDYR